MRSAGAVFNNLSPPDFYAEIAKEHKVPLIEDVLPALGKHAGTRFGEPSSLVWTKGDEERRG